MTSFKGARRLTAVLLLGTMLSSVPAEAQRGRRANAAPAAPATNLLAPPTPAPAPPTDGGIVKSIAVEGSQRIEPETVRSYVRLRAGEAYTRESLDEAIRQLFETELFNDVQIRDDNGALTIVVRENPIINRIVFEGNRRVKEDKLNKELKLAPRQIFTRSKVRADITRIIELYRRQGRFAASVEPKIVQLDQNRVDLVYEISEGPKSKVRQINILGNKVFSDGTLRAQMYTKRSRFYRFFSSTDTYDADRLAVDQSKLRQFYLTNGYADMRVVSAVAELTPDRRDFIITYVVEEGERYKFGDVNVESEIRDLKPATIKSIVPMKKGDWYNAKTVEDTLDRINETAGLLGYAFAQSEPEYRRNKDDKTMDITFRVADAPRVYVESVNVNGNTVTRDKVVRREFRLAEGDAFNSVSIKRSQDRIRSLGFFQEKLEVAQKPGSGPDRVVLEANVEEKATGQLELSAGYSSLERFLVNASIRQPNFRGMGQELRASVSYSAYSRSVELGFTEPYLFDRNVALAGDIFRRDLSSFNFTDNNRNTTYSQVTTGGQLRVGVPLTEFVSVAGRYGLSFDNVKLDQNLYYTNGVCDPTKAGRYLCDALGKRTTSSIGYSLVFDNLNNRLRPSAGQRVVFSQDFAGLGGNVRYLKTVVDGSKFWGLGKGFVFSAHLEGGYIKSFQQASSPSSDPVRLVDRFFLGEPQIRGFDIRGVGPRVQRQQYQLDANGNVVVDAQGNLQTVTGRNNLVDDALGGRAYYMSRLELEIPLGAGARELGLRPSIFVDAGAVFGLREPTLANGGLIDNRTGTNTCTLTTATAGQPTSITLPYSQACPANYTLTSTIAPYREVFLGNTPKPRISIGVGVNWNSPFGPLRLDLAKAIVKAPGDVPKLFTFNVGAGF